MARTTPKILFIDFYDSFTHNLGHLIRRTVPSCEIYLIRNDSLDYNTLYSLIPCFSAIVVGPGPGSPARDADVGIVKKLWSLPDSHLLPIFGVCLGFQSFTLAFGGSLRTMSVVKHGMISRIEHVSKDLFEGIAKDIEGTRYHSLCVDIIDKQSSIDIDPLAWADDGADNGRVLMAARHPTKPFWGVQYHPESICTRGGGEEIFRNFWNLAGKWTKDVGREICDFPDGAAKYLGEPWPHLQSQLSPTVSDESLSVSHLSFDLPNLSVTRICEALGVNNSQTNFVLLDSAALPGRYTIIGALMSSTLSIRYTIPDTHVVLQQGLSNAEHKPLPTNVSIWDWLAEFMSLKIVSGQGCEDSPFWGGLIGYLSYELGVADLGVPLKHRAQGVQRNADVNLVFVERSIVLDRETGRVHVQSLLPNDEPWLQQMVRELQETKCSPIKPPIALSSSCHLISPSREYYVPQVVECKHHLSVGSSYELCLTAPSTLHLPALPSWDLYVRLRAANPAPHAAYLRLGPTTLMCSSPERFLKWDRSGRCQLRPIKGTLRKRVIDKDGKIHEMERKDADELLGRNIKERAENLMIVDLVRHDLGGVVEEADGVHVEQLMGIEEYETVWQMVSVISGTVSRGWEALRKSLPPGSMTGAPKKRSVEILQDIEGQERGVYSGVCGYWCVGGGGDWAVIIRSCFRYQNESEKGGSLAWTLGAGGAITALSDPVAEWEEMRVKLGSVGRAFGVDEL